MRYRRSWIVAGLCASALALSASAWAQNPGQRPAERPRGDPAQADARGGGTRFGDALPGLSAELTAVTPGQGATEGRLRIVRRTGAAS